MRHNWDAIFEPSAPKVGMRHFRTAVFKSQIERAREDDPARVKAIDETLARIREREEGGSGKQPQVASLTGPGLQSDVEAKPWG